MKDITELLNRWNAGDPQALEELTPLVYGDLKRLAQRQLMHERNAATLQCAALVQEAYLRLMGPTRIQWNGRAHFFAVAARVMRRILVEHARRHLSQKRGAGVSHEPLTK